MAVPEQIPYNIYTANGITTVFPYEFYILQAGDLAVSIDGATVTTGFTVSGVGTVNGGEVIFLIAPAAGSTVMLERIIPATRTTDYQDNGDLLADTINQDFDRVWMAIRQAFISLGIALSRPLMGGPFNAKGYRIENLGTPVNKNDASTKNYVDDVYAYLLQTVGTAINTIENGLYGYITKKSFALGNTLRNPNEVLFSESDGEYYRWDGSLPKVVPPGSTPESTGGVGNGAWKSVGDAALRSDLSRPGGASIPSLKQGGNVQEAISYVTLEMLGGGVDVTDNSPALQAFFDLAHAGICTELRLGPGKYKCASSVSVKAPHVIRGVGANFANGVQDGESSLVDDRPSGENDFFITVESESHSSSDAMLYGWYWDCFSIVGIKSRNNRGVYFDAQGWAFQKNNLFIRDFGKTGLAFNYCADGTVLGLFIGNCGGVVDGVAYYGLDLYPEDFAPMRGVPNLIGFYRLHIEHCRYMIRLAGFDLAFTDSHFEIGFPVYDNNEHSPCINVRRLLRPVTFNNCYFTDPGWKSLVPESSANPSADINSVPAMIGTTYTSGQVLGGGEYDSKIELRGCKFTTHNGYGLYVGLPFIPVDMSDCHAMNCGMINSRVPFIVGPRSKLISNKLYCKSITGDMSDYAALVNDKVAPAVQVTTGWGTFNGNDILLFSATTPSSLAAIVAANAIGSIVVGNKVGGYTQEFGGGRAGSQVYGGLSVTNNVTVTDVLPGSLVSSGPSMSFRLPSAYTNCNPVYSADGASFSFSPNVDTGNAYLGMLTARWSEIRAKTATIATSDGRLKTDVRDVSEAEKRVAQELKSLLRAFRFNEAAHMPPSDSGKIHFGIIAQDAVAVFEKYGLDANAYAMIVHDKWDAVEAERDINGDEITPALDSGDRYGVRYEELLAFIIATL